MSLITLKNTSSGEASLELQNFAPVPPRARIPTTIWNALQPLIRRLYVDEDKTLKEVMAFVAQEHDFIATPKQFKGRIKAWGLDKNNKESEASAILRMKIDRDAVGKKSAFCVRGRSVTVDDVLRYFKRKRIVDPYQHVQKANVSVPKEVECWTPSPSPSESPQIQVSQIERNVDLETSGSYKFFAEVSHPISFNNAIRIKELDDKRQCYFSNEQIHDILFSNPHIQSFDIPSSPPPPQGFLALERLLLNIKDYGTFEVLNQSHKNPCKNSKGSSDFNDLCYAGVQSMNTRSFVEGRRFFSKASALLAPILLQREPRTLEIFFDVLLYLRSSGYSGVSTAFINLVVGLSSIIYEAGHPWGVLFSGLEAIEDSDFDFAIVEGWRCASDSFADRFGKYHFTAVRCYTRFLCNASCTQDSSSSLSMFLLQGAAELADSDEQLLHIKWVYGRALYAQKRFKEAIVVLEEVLLQYRKIGDPFEIFSLDILALCHSKLGNIREAEEKHREAIKRSELALGQHDPSTLNSKNNLQCFLRDVGRDIEADLLMQDIDAGIGEDDISNMQGVELDPI